ncbi:MAG TPA: tripartite tricarboxylate transporter substrate binding protein [Pseudolabrys sp.]|nr:tripartite tricarboxylate transporter substrate binding protein [Pseudolabrys sp.]
MKKLIALGWACFALLSISGQASAQSDYPTHSIRIIVGFAAGGATDVAARILASKMSEELGQSLIVENRPGASTTIAGEAVAKSEPDGYTLFMAGNANAVNAVAESKLPFDVLRDFAPIGIAVTSPSVLVAHPDTGIKSVADIITEAKANPGKVMYASAGAAAVSHLAGELFSYDQGIKLTHVPYKGSTQAMTDVLAGRIAIMFAPISTALPHIRSGKLVALAVTFPQRLDDLPDTPTLAEAGIKNVDLSIWFGLVAPKGTPPDRLAKLGAAMDRALTRDDVRKALSVQGIIPAVGQGPDAFTRRMQSEIERLRVVFAATGMKMSE